MIIYVQFGFNQMYSFWENGLSQFLIGSYNKTCSDNHFGFPIHKPIIKKKQKKQTNKPTKAKKEDNIRNIPNMEQFYHTCGFREAQVTLSMVPIVPVVCEKQIEMIKVYRPWWTQSNDTPSHEKWDHEVNPFQLLLVYDDFIC